MVRGTAIRASVGLCLLICLYVRISQKPDEQTSNCLLCICLWPRLSHGGVAKLHFRFWWWRLTFHRMARLGDANMLHSRGESRGGSTSTGAKCDIHDCLVPSLIIFVYWKIDKPLVEEVAAVVAVHGIGSAKWRWTAGDRLHLRNSWKSLSGSEV